MRIDIYKLLEGAGRAAGTAVIIDVFRAGSFACYALAAGAERIVPVADLETAYALRRDHPDWVLAGERGCIRPQGFDLGNSPSEVAKAALSGKTVVHATTAGTKGLAAAIKAGADEVLTCAFVNMAATAAYLAAKTPEIITIVAMGKAGEMPAPEDDLCAMYLKNELEQVPNVFPAIVKHLRQSASADIFFGESAIVPQEDFDLCLSLDAFDFALRAATGPDGLVALRRADS